MAFTTVSQFVMPVACGSILALRKQALYTLPPHPSSVPSLVGTIAKFLLFQERPFKVTP